MGGSKSFRGLSFLTALFIVLGSILLCLSVALPILMESVVVRRGTSAPFMVGFLRSLTPFMTLASMASSFIAAAAILSFEKSRPNGMSLRFGLLTLAVFVVELSLSIFLSVTRTPAISEILGIYMLIGLVPFGLACTMFTLASIISQGRVDLEGKA